MASSLAPRNDATRKAWLRNLKEGDEVAWIDGYRPKIISVKRDRDGNFKYQSYHFTQATGKGKANNYRDTKGWIVPITDECRRIVAAYKAREDLVEAMSRSGLKEFSDEQILAVAAILWPNGIGTK